METWVKWLIFSIILIVVIVIVILIIVAIVRRHVVIPYGGGRIIIPRYLDVEEGFDLEVFLPKSYSYSSLNRLNKILNKELRELGTDPSQIAYQEITELMIFMWYWQVYKHKMAASFSGDFYKDKHKYINSFGLSGKKAYDIIQNKFDNGEFSYDHIPSEDAIEHALSTSSNYMSEGQQRVASCSDYTPYPHTGGYYPYLNSHLEQRVFGSQWHRDIKPQEVKYSHGSTFGKHSVSPYYYAWLPRPERSLVSEYVTVGAPTQDLTIPPSEMIYKKIGNSNMQKTYLRPSQNREYTTETE